MADHQARVPRGRGLFRLFLPMDDAIPLPRRILTCFRSSLEAFIEIG